MYRKLIPLFLLLLSSCATAGYIQNEQAQMLFHMGLESFYLSDYSSANTSFLEVVKKDKQNDAAFYYLSQIALFQNDVSQASKFLQQALKLQPDNFWYRLQQAKLAVSMEAPEKAEELYQQLADDFPNKPQLLYDQINLYATHSQNQKAISTLDKLESMEGISESGVLMRFNLLIDSLPEQAIAALERFSETETSPRVLSVLGDYSASKEDLDKAMGYYQKALEADPSFMPALFGQAEVYRMRRQFDLFFENINPFLASPDMSPTMVREYMKQLMESRGFVATFQPQVDTLFLSVRKGHPVDSTLAYMYAGYLIQTNRGDRAKEVVMENAQQYRQEHDPMYQVLVLAYVQQDWETIENFAPKLLELYPDDTDARSLYAMALWQNKKLDASIQAFLAILEDLDKKDEANRLQTWTFLGDVYHEAGQSEASFHAYEQALKLDAENVAVLNNYAYFLCLENRDLEKALEMSKKTVDIEPTNATYLDTYGWILHLLGRTAQAKDVFRQAMAYGGKESAEMLNHYGDVMNALNEPLMALVYWRQAYAIEPREEIAAKIKANSK